MAFVPGSIANTLPVKRTSATTGGFVPGSVAGTAPKFGGKGKLDSSSELYNQAVRSGYQGDADNVLKRLQGEKPKEIFSGGFISDVFDGLSAVQYGVTGMLKGKTFSEGVKTRQSFSDQDALGDKGIPGMIAGIALDIAVDPLTYIAPVTILKKVPLLSKLLKGGKEAVFGKMTEKAIQGGEAGRTVETLEGGTNVGRYFADKFSYMNGVDPTVREGYEKSVKNIGVGITNLSAMSKGLTELSDDVAKKILTKDETGRVARVGIDELRKTLSPEDLAKVEPAWARIDELGKEAVDVGLLSKEKFEENIGEYIKNSYTEYELAKKQGLFGSMKIGVKGIKKRVEDLTPEQMKELGQIENPAYLVFKSTFDLMKDVENAKFLNRVAKDVGTDVAQEGFIQMPKSARLVSLQDKYVPESIHNLIQEITKPVESGLGKKLMADFKFSKVILNPATHARNVMSNMVLNWWKLGIGPWRVDKYASSIKEIATNGEMWQRAQKVGGGMDTFASQEIINLLDDPSLMGFGSKVGNAWGSVKKKLGGFYQQEENVAKLTAFTDYVKKGFSDDEAWKAAESATFNYAQVTPFVRKLRTSLFGFPFITFGLKAAPVALETIAKNPRRVSVFGKIKTGFENQGDTKETERERASEAPWIKDGFYIKMPFKDSNGRSAYFDLSYILPFGDLVSGQFTASEINRETGLPENKLLSVASNAPAVNLAKEIFRNQDFYGDKIWQDSDSTEKKLGDIMRHLSKVMLPPPVADEIPGGHKSDGTRRQKGFTGTLSTPQNKINQQRNLMQEMLKQVGAKFQPIDADIQESMSEWNKKKALQTLGQEKGYLKELNINYVPKK